MTARKEPRAALLLTPGASADRNQPALVAIDERLSAEGVVVERVDLPSRAPGAIAAVREAAVALAESTGLPQNRVGLGGRSFGGRMCSMAVAEGLDALALVLISYPLHPPGKAAQLRTEHFPALRVPCVFISGTKDAFGSPEELRAAARSIPGDVTHHFLDGGNHGLRGLDDAVSRLVSDALQKFT